jgi:hypothetical protein
MQARYYDPVIGRFYSNDPVGFIGTIDSFNRYSYVGNNPYKYTDPTGMMSCEFSTCEGVSGVSSSSKSNDDNTATPSIEGKTETSLAFSDVAGGLGQHTFVVVNGPNGEIFVIRGGPSQDPGFLATLAVSGSGSVPTYAYGNLVIDEGAAAQRTEAKSPLVGTQLIGYFNDFNSVKNTLSNYGAAVNAAKIPYRPLSTNSNAFAFSAVTKILGYRPASNFVTPGSQTVLKVK